MEKRIIKAIMMINMAFEHDDKPQIISALMTTFNMLTPYIDSRFKKCRCRKKIHDLADIHDKDEFIEEGHAVYCLLLKIMHEHGMLPVTLKNE